MSAAAARRYAEALYELAAEQNCLAEVAGGLDGVRKALTGDPSLLGKILSVRATAAEKHALVEGKLAAGAHPFVANVIKLLVDRNREADLPHFLLGFFEHMEEEQGVILATVESAQALSDGDVAALSAQLSDATGKKVVLQSETEPELIGGIRLTLGSTRIDASVKRQLDNIEARLKAAV
jgi:F-type H+-transporting ATPase subunit delta